MRVWGDRYSRELQRYTLARRMLGLQARTQTVSVWAGLPKRSVRTLNRSHGWSQLASNLRHGPAPTSVAHFLRSPIARMEAAVFAGLFRAFHLLPERPLRNRALDLPSVERGERLCDAFEMYRSLVPDSTMSMEQAILILTESVPGGDLVAERCIECGCAMVMERYGTPRKLCGGCFDAAVHRSALGLTSASERTATGSSPPASL